MKHQTRQLINYLMEAGHCPDPVIEREMLLEAAVIFGDGAAAWLKTPCIGLDQERPIDVIERGDADKVRIFLVRIAAGVYT